MLLLMHLDSICSFWYTSERCKHSADGASMLILLTYYSDQSPDICFY